MQLKSNGYNYQVFEGFREDSLRSHKITSNQYQFDKKFQAYYRLWRYKNNSKNYRDSNNESMHMIFDSNLSPDFSTTHINLQTQESLSIHLIEVHQKDTGQTQLVMRIEHVDQEQNLYQNQDYFYIDTLPGTVAKRMKFYKQEFDRISQDIIHKYLEHGFSVKFAHTLENLASYIYYAYVKRPMGCNYDIAKPINQILAVFSVLNCDCLTQGKTTLDEFNPFIHWEKIINFKVGSISPEQQDCIDRIATYRKEHQNDFEQMIKASMFKEWSGYKIDLGKLKAQVMSSPLSEAGMN